MPLLSLLNQSSEGDHFYPPFPRHVWGLYVVLYWLWKWLWSFCIGSCLPHVSDNVRENVCTSIMVCTNLDFYCFLVCDQHWGDNVWYMRRLTIKSFFRGFFEGKQHSKPIITCSHHLYSLRECRLWFVNVMETIVNDGISNRSPPLALLCGQPACVLNPSSSPGHNPVAYLPHGCHDN